MKRMLLAAILTAATFGACSGRGDRPGDPAVYERIESMTSCSALQSEFDTAMNNAEAREPGDPLRDVSIAYAKAAEDRRQDLDC